MSSNVTISGLSLGSTGWTNTSGSTLTLFVSYSFYNVGEDKVIRTVGLNNLFTEHTGTGNSTLTGSTIIQLANGSTFELYSYGNAQPTFSSVSIFVLH